MCISWSSLLCWQTNMALLGRVSRIKINVNYSKLGEVLYSVFFLLKTFTWWCILRYMDILTHKKCNNIIWNKWFETNNMQNFTVKKLFDIARFLHVSNHISSLIGARLPMIIQKVFMKQRWVKNSVILPCFFLNHNIAMFLYLKSLGFKSWVLCKKTLEVANFCKFTLHL